MALSRFSVSKDKMVAQRKYDTLVMNLITETREIHAGYLLTQEGDVIRQRLCLKIGAEDPQREHWRHFADYLSSWDDEACVSHDQQDNIDHYYKHGNGPVWWVLFTFAQWDDARLSSVIGAVKRMNRIDIIDGIFAEVRKLVAHVQTNGLFDSNLKIFKPARVLRAPEILRPSYGDMSKHFQIVDIVPQDGNINPLVQINKPCALKVMLTFADDGEETAYKIAKILRNHEPPIGVLILKEQSNYVHINGDEFVADWYKRVDMIIPILTKGYFKTIKAGRSKNMNLELMLNKDEQYAKYIHTLFVAEYLRNGCRNLRVRSIYPTDNPCHRSRLLPPLNIYFPESNIQKFIPNLIGEKITQT